MLVFNEPFTTPIRIQRKTLTYPGGIETESWDDVIDKDILCSWKNKFGGELYQAVTINAKEPAVLKLWYIPGIDEACRVIRVEDGTEIIDGETEYKGIFDIINVDDVNNRHQQMTIEVKRYVRG